MSDEQVQDLFLSFLLSFPNTLRKIRDLSWWWWLRRDEEGEEELSLFLSLVGFWSGLDHIQRLLFYLDASQIWYLILLYLFIFSTYLSISIYIPLYMYLNSHPEAFFFSLNQKIPIHFFFLHDFPSPSLIFPCAKIQCAWKKNHYPANTPGIHAYRSGSIVIITANISRSLSLLLPSISTSLCVHGSCSSSVSS